MGRAWWIRATLRPGPGRLRLTTANFGPAPEGRGRPWATSHAVVRRSWFAKALGSAPGIRLLGAPRSASPVTGTPRRRRGTFEVVALEGRARITPPGSFHMIPARGRDARVGAVAGGAAISKARSTLPRRWRGRRHPAPATVPRPRRTARRAPSPTCRDRRARRGRHGRGRGLAPHSRDGAFPYGAPRPGGTVGDTVSCRERLGRERRVRVGAGRRDGRPAPPVVGSRQFAMRSTSRKVASGSGRIV